MEVATLPTRQATMARESKIIGGKVRKRTSSGLNGSRRDSGGSGGPAIQNNAGGAAGPVQAVPATASSSCSCTFAADCKSFRAMVLGSPVNWVLLAVPPAVAGPHLQWRDEVIFSLNFFAILPLAGLLGACTEELAASLGDTIGGLLNATFGNAVELILSVFALRDGLVDMVQGSLLGSILSNLLLVLGMCFLFGGVRYKTQRYNAEGSRVQSSLLLLATIALTIPSMAFLDEVQAIQEDPDETDGKPGQVIVSAEQLFVSRGCATCLAILYCLYLVFQLGTHSECFAAESPEEEGVEGPEESMSPAFATIMLMLITCIVAVCSEGLVGSVEGLTKSLGISRSFIGVVLLPIVGNAAEHLTAVTVAMKDKLDLSLGVALGSSTQIALFVVPFTVLAGWYIGTPMNLNFGTMGAGLLLLTVLIVGGLTGDGESNWIEGAMLLAAYFIVAITLWAM